MCFGTIIKIHFLCTFLCPTERTPRERRENAPTPPKPKKCVLLRFAPPTGLVLGDFPLSITCPFFVCYSELFGYPVYVLPLGVHAELQPIGRSTAQRSILLPLTCHAFASGLASIPSSFHSLKIQRTSIAQGLSGSPKISRFLGRGEMAASQTRARVSSCKPISTKERWQLITEYCLLACEPID